MLLVYVGFCRFVISFSYVSSDYCILCKCIDVSHIQVDLAGYDLNRGGPHLLLSAGRHGAGQCLPLHAESGLYRLCGSGMVSLSEASRPHQVRVLF